MKVIVKDFQLLRKPIHDAETRPKKKRQEKEVSMSLLQQLLHRLHEYTSGSTIQMSNVHLIRMKQPGGMKI
jgi:hypothetical protein